MEDPRPIPGAISYRQLQALLHAAPGEQNSPGAAGSGDDSLQQALEAWNRSSRQLLAQLQQLQQSPDPCRHPRQLMALGALQAHVTLGLQALARGRGQKD